MSLILTDTGLITSNVLEQPQKLLGYYNKKRPLQRDILERPSHLLDPALVGQFVDGSLQDCINFTQRAFLNGRMDLTRAEASGLEPLRIAVVDLPTPPEGLVIARV